MLVEVSVVGDGDVDCMKRVGEITGGDDRAGYEG